MGALRVKRKASRKTVQRQVILDELRKVTNHPSAAEVYVTVRRRLPRISLGTVYRNLELLSEEGKILKLECAGMERRYDGNLASHCHVRCVQCGRMDDMHREPSVGFDAAARRETGYEVTGHHLEFFGVCPRCRCRGGKRL